MAQFLTTQDILHHLEEIMLNAESEIYMVTPFLRYTDPFFDKLATLAENNITVKIVFGRNELKNEEKAQLARISTLELYFLENINSKCYFNEKKMLITSMNMYDFSVRNYEMGILIDHEKDKEIFDKARKESFSILKSAERLFLNKKNIGSNSPGEERGNAFSKRIELEKDSPGLNKYVEKLMKTDNGTCIRCGEKIPLDADKPYCIACFNVWSFFGNSEYIENFCHKCGKEEETTMLRPLCASCYQNYVKV